MSFDDDDDFADAPSDDHECWAHAEKIETPHRGYDYECTICGRELNSRQTLKDPGT